MATDLYLAENTVEHQLNKTKNSAHEHHGLHHEFSTCHFTDL